MNPGKRFEEDFFNSFFREISVAGSRRKTRLLKYPQVQIDRVYDNVGGYVGVVSFCDFYSYTHPNMFYFELKSVTGKSLPFDNISDNQFVGLLARSNVFGIFAGLVIEFRDEAGGNHRAFFLDIREAASLRACADRKSISLGQCERLGLELFGQKKRVRYMYNVLPWLSVIKERCPHER